MTIDEIDSILAQRQAARDRKDWAESDRLRALLKSGGVMVVDTPDGQKATGGSEFTKDWKPCFYSFQSKINFLEHSLSVMRKREAADSARIAELVKENLELKYGKSSQVSQQKDDS